MCYRIIRGDSMKYYSIGQFSKLVNKSVPTLRLWDKESKLRAHHVTDGGHRYYSEEQVYQVLQRPFNKKDRKVIGYCRVSSNKQKDDLIGQIENVKTYMIAKGYSFEIISDIGKRK